MPPLMGFRGVFSLCTERAPLLNTLALFDRLSACLFFAIYRSLPRAARAALSRFCCNAMRFSDSSFLLSLRNISALRFTFLSLVPITSREELARRPFVRLVIPFSSALRGGLARGGRLPLRGRL